jgi:hypothetical protein
VLHKNNPVTTVQKNLATWYFSVQLNCDLIISESTHTHRTSELPSVAVPPRWTVEPTDASVASGQDVIMHCQADGYPVPSITWRKAVGTLTCVIAIQM